MFCTGYSIEVVLSSSQAETSIFREKEKMEYIRRIHYALIIPMIPICMYPVDVTADEPIRVVYNKPSINHEFEETIKELWRYASLICWMFL